MLESSVMEEEISSQGPSARARARARPRPGREASSLRPMLDCAMVRADSVVRSGGLVEVPADLAQGPGDVLRATRTTKTVIPAIETKARPPKKIKKVVSRAAARRVRV